jgi:hypothetical protein
LTLEGGTDRLSRNIGTKLPLYFAENPLRAQISRTINVIYQSHLQGSITLKLQEEIDMFPESSVTNYRPTPRYFPEVRRPQLHHGGSLKSGMIVADSKLGAVLIYLLTPRSRVLLEKLTGSVVSQKIPRIFGT